VKIHIHQPYLEVPLGKGYGEIGRYAALSDPPLSAHHQDLVPDVKQSLLNFEILHGMSVILGPMFLAVFFSRHLVMNLPEKNRYKPPVQAFDRDKMKSARADFI